MANHVLAFDLDGTMLVHVGDVLFDKPQSLREGCILDRAVVERVRALIADGHEVHVVTARGPKVAAVTRDQVARIHPGLVRRLHMQDTWVDYDTARRRKAKKLKQIEAEAYVGDHLMDEMAAEDAGIPFLNVEAYRRGASLLALLGEPASDVQRFGYSDLVGDRRGQDPHVLQVVPGDGVAGAVRSPEQAGLAPLRGEAAVAGQEPPLPVKGLVGKHEAVGKAGAFGHGPSNPGRVVSPTRRGSGSAAKARGAL